MVPAALVLPLLYVFLITTSHHPSRTKPFMSKAAMNVYWWFFHESNSDLRDERNDDACIFWRIRAFLVNLFWYHRLCLLDEEASLALSSIQINCIGLSVTDDNLSKKHCLRSSSWSLAIFPICFIVIYNLSFMAEYIVLGDTYILDLLSSFDAISSKYKSGREWTILRSICISLSFNTVPCRFALNLKYVGVWLHIHALYLAIYFEFVLGYH